MNNTNITFDEVLAMATQTRRLSGVDKRQIAEEVIQESLPESFLEHFKDFDLTFEYYDKDFLSKYNSCSIAQYLKQIFDIGDYYNPDTKMGLQGFFWDDDEREWFKSWKDRSSSYMNNTYTRIDQRFKKQCMMSSYSMDGIIMPHYFSRFIKQQYNSKLFNVFRYVPYIKHNLDLIQKHKNLKLPYKECENYKYWQYISCKNKVVGYSQSQNSHMLWVDIDKDPDNTKFNRFMELMHNPHILYMEKSKYSNGWHIFIRYDESIPNLIRPQIEHFCKDNGVKIECCFDRHFLQCPASIDYSPVKMRYYHRTGKIEFRNQLSFKELGIALLECIDSFENNPVVNSVEKLKAIITNTYNAEIVADVIESTCAESAPVPVKKNWDIITKNIVRYVYREGSELKHKKNLTFKYAEKGNKFHAMMNNIAVCVNMGITNPDEIRKYLKQYQGSSTTIANIPDNDINRCVGYVLNASDSNGVKINTTNTFVSNLDRIPSEYKKVLDDGLYSFKQQFYNNAKRYGFYKDKTGTRKQDLFSIAETMYYEIVGLFLFRVKNPEKAILPEHIRFSFNYDQLTNFYISVKYVDLLLQHLSASGSINGNFKPRHIRDLFCLTMGYKFKFLYRNMDKSVYKDVDKEYVSNTFINGLPIQIDMGKFHNIDSFLVNYANMYLKRFTLSVNGYIYGITSNPIYTKPTIKDIYYVDIKNIRNYYFENRLLNNSSPPD